MSLDEELAKKQMGIVRKNNEWYHQRELMYQKKLHDEAKSFIHNIKLIKDHAYKGIDDFINHM